MLCHRGLQFVVDDKGFKMKVMVQRGYNWKMAESEREEEDREQVDKGTRGQINKETWRLR